MIEGGGGVNFGSKLCDVIYEFSYYNTAILKLVFNSFVLLEEVTKCAFTNDVTQIWKIYYPLFLPCHTFMPKALCSNVKKCGIPLPLYA